MSTKIISLLILSVYFCSLVAIGEFRPSEQPTDLHQVVTSLQLVSLDSASPQGDFTTQFKEAVQTLRRTAGLQVLILGKQQTDDPHPLLITISLRSPCLPNFHQVIEPPVTVSLLSPFKTPSDYNSPDLPPPYHPPISV